MKKFYIYIVISLLYTINGLSQNSIFFFKKDTVFITYDTIKINSIVKINQKKILKSKTDKIIGISTTYNLLDSLEIKRKKEQEIKIKNNPGIGLHGTDDIYFGIHFRYTNIERKLKIRKIKKDPFYSNHRKYFLNIKNPSSQDSLAFDNYIFFNVFRRYKSANSLIKINNIELKDNRVIHFDGSRKMNQEIKKIYKEPVYIYILDKIVLNKCDNKKYYYFNEVSVVSKPVVR